MKSSEQSAVWKLVRKNTKQDKTKQDNDPFKNFEQFVLKYDQTWMKLAPLFNGIEKLLKQGFSKKTVYSYLKEEQLLDCSYKEFLSYLKKVEKNSEQLKDKVKTTSASKTEKTVSQVVQNTTEAKETIDQKPEEQETEVEAKASQNKTQQEQETTQTVEPETKEETSFENREFGKLPAGKVWKDLTDDEKDIIRKEREKLRAEENRKRLAENIEANRIAREEAEKNKFNHDPNAKPPGYWEKENRENR